MNIEKIFNALDEDEMNSSIGIISRELELQGYKVKIEGNNVSSEEIFNGDAEFLEKHPELIKVEICSIKGEKQKFRIRFIDYHTCIFEK